MVVSYRCRSMDHTRFDFIFEPRNSTSHLPVPGTGLNARFFFLQILTYN